MDIMVRRSKGEELRPASSSCRAVTCWSCTWPSRQWTACTWRTGGPAYPPGRPADFLNKEHNTNHSFLLLFSFCHKCCYIVRPIPPTCGLVSEVSATTSLLTLLLS